MTDQKTLLVSLGSTNKAKKAAIQFSLSRIFPSKPCQVTGSSVPSGVTDQPMSNVETITGAENRARAVLKLNPTCDYAIGIEGGIEKIGNRHFESGWVCVIDGKTGVAGFGSSGRFELSEKIMEMIYGGIVKN